MASRNSKIIIAVIAVAAVAVLAVSMKGRVTASAPEAAQVCAPVDITVDAANSVHGLKEGKLFAYVDLADMAPALACHNDAEIQAMLEPVVASNVGEWWKEERLAGATQAEVHIITILNKDEYARASFNSALAHGKMDFTRDGTAITPVPATLTFDTLRTAIEKKK